MSKIVDGVKRTLRPAKVQCQIGKEGNGVSMGLASEERGRG